MVGYFHHICSLQGHGALKKICSDLRSLNPQIRSEVTDQSKLRRARQCRMVLSSAVHFVKKTAKAIGVCPSLMLKSARFGMDSLSSSEKWALVGKPLLSRVVEKYNSLSSVGSKARFVVKKTTKRTQKTSVKSQSLNGVALAMCAGRITYDQLDYVRYVHTSLFNTLQQTTLFFSWV